MNKPRVLQIGPLSERFNQELAQRYEVSALWQQADPLAFLREQGEQFIYMVSSARFGCTADQLRLLPNLRVICSFGVGYDPYPLELLRERGIAISTTPDVLNDCVADLAMGLMIDSARRLSASDRFVRSGAWNSTTGFPLARRVSGKRLGIVGLGRIGEAVAQRAAGFSMPVRYHNRRPVAGSRYQHEPDLLELARWADFLVLTCPGGQATYHLINAEVLAALGADGFLINVARGSVVDESALIAALQDRVIAGAGLDVYEREPQVPAALRELDNVVLLPHVGSASVETRQQMADLVLDNLQSFIATGKLLTPL
ncbi:lactate dehydrogenase-like 2-hydroxyacid dehydrogenase [Ectopseudomonas oleovorans]|uniref:Lactate dehydrogenase-like 2-hydroxyacid dehydrogenase n=1 Tax=Ectopseudomonas oleovorans TaxID=301 RepID=A0A397MIW3_ECTOL|nr:2-hydroxyacid dehydrogenase [Pseudomonas oleovorans]RIA22285.1 lactate dehydrogenase-like 2-hydroxyacid dehydrogenase [Pseudomonas oleovorans]